MDVTQVGTLHRDFQAAEERGREAARREAAVSAVEQRGEDLNVVIIAVGKIAVGKRE